MRHVAEIVKLNDIRPRPFTKMDNELFERLMAASDVLTYRQFKIVLTIWRQTDGYHKGGDCLPLSQLCKLAQIPNRGDASEAIKGLIEMNMVRKSPTTVCVNGAQLQTYVYELNHNYDEWQPVRKSRTVRKSPKTPGVNHATTKERNTKESKSYKAADAALPQNANAYISQVGVPYMVEHGLKEAQARSFLFSLLGKGPKGGYTPEQVAAAIDAAIQNDAGEPKAYIQGVLRGKKQAKNALDDPFFGL